MNTLEHEVETENLIQCRASHGIALPPAAWEAGKPVQFIYAPAGRHLITAGFRKGESITICVENDSQTAVDLQASYDHLMATEPNQEPFSDEDHDAKKATLRFPTSVTKFTWGQIKGNEGVVVAAEPTSYGAEAVNGKVYRSWSPEFATDADYSKAKNKAGHWSFPEGVRGSESNPARIVGVSFVMGALTNRPAFRAMPPVKAKKADGFRVKLEGGEVVNLHSERGEVQATWSDAARQAAAESKKRHGLEGAKFENTPDYFKKWQLHHEGMAEHHEEELRMQPTDKGEREGHEEALEMHDKAAFHYGKAAKHLASGNKGVADHHLSMAERYSVDANGSDYKRGEIAASSPILAHQADELTLSDLHCKVQAAASADGRFKGVSDPSGCISSCGCYVADIIRDEDKNEWFAVISAGNKMKRVEFLIDAEDGSVVLGDEVKEVARKTVYAVDALCYNGEVVKATWSDAARRAAAASKKAHAASLEANEAHELFKKTGEESHSIEAYNKHIEAYKLHNEASKLNGFGKTSSGQIHSSIASHHYGIASVELNKIHRKLKSSSPDLSSLYLKGAAQEPTLEQIYARVGANGVPAAVTN